MRNQLFCVVMFVLAACSNLLGVSPLTEGSSSTITSFGFRTEHNPSLPVDVTATMTDSMVTATVPFGTDVTALVATYEAGGAVVAVGDTAQISGATANDFTNPVSYTVIRADGTTRSFTVAITVAASSAKELTAFGFLTAHNAGLAADVTATISGNAIRATVPFGTDISALVATFETTGTVTVDGAAQTSGDTMHDFRSPVSYTVAAADGTTRTYDVTVDVASSTAKEITSFAFLSTNNGQLAADATATINGTAIDVTVPFGTTTTPLVAAFQTTGASVAIGAAAQTSGVTPNNFSQPKAYVVTAADGSTKTFTVTVTVAASSAKAITSFVFRSIHNPGLSSDLTATISGTSIFASAPAGTSLTNLVATFTTTGASVTVAGTAQVSGVTPNDFSSTKTYRVIAADGSAQNFSVTISVVADSSKEITAFSFLTVNNPGLAANAIGRITGTSISVVVPVGTNLTSLIASFSTTGASVKVSVTVQTSDVTANNFSSPVVYRVSAGDGTIKDFTVSVTLTGFSPKVDFPTGSDPQSVKIGDLNGDGKPDLAVANRLDNSVSVLLGTTATGATTPSFAAKKDFAAGDQPHAVAIGDLDGNGKLDLVVANANANTISILFNTTTTGSTNPTFAPNVDVATNFGPQDVVLADLDGDGKLDIAVASFGFGKICVFHNATPSGATTPTLGARVDFTSGSGTTAVAAGDFNNDGKLDLAAANELASTVSILLNTTPANATTSSFSPAVEFVTGEFPVGIVVGDLNADGKPDVVASNTNGGTVSVLFDTTATGAPTPSLAPKGDFRCAGECNSAALGDLDGDGKIDIAVSNGGFSMLTSLLNATGQGAPAPSFPTRIDFATGSFPRSVALADFNGDGRPDAVLAATNASVVSVLLNNSN